MGLPFFFRQSQKLVYLCQHFLPVIFDVAGNKHMEYINDRGEYLDAPLEELLANFRQHYPNMFSSEAEESDLLPDSADWEADVAREVGLP